MAGPDFSNLGVTNPTTGKPVYLGAGEISTVLGATGGVAKTPFAAGVEGAISGIQTGQNIVSNQLTIEGQQQQNQQRAAQIQQQAQTQAAQIIATNNQNTAMGLAKQAEIDKLNRDAAVLAAVQSGDAQQIQSVISDPNLMLSAVEQDKFIGAAVSRLRAQGPLTPEFENAYNVYNKTRDIYAQGPVLQQYETARDAAAGLPIIQKLKATGGYSTDEIMQGMVLGQQTNPMTGQPETYLVAPDGKGAIKVTDEKDVQALAPFFAAREKLPRAQAQKSTVFNGDQGAAAAPPPIKETDLLAAPTATATPTATAPAQGGEVLPSGIQSNGQPGGIVVNGKSVTFRGFEWPGVTGHGNGATPDSVDAGITAYRRVLAATNGDQKAAIAAMGKAQAGFIKQDKKVEKGKIQQAELKSQMQQVSNDIKEGVRLTDESGFALGPGIPNAASRIGSQIMGDTAGLRGEELIKNASSQQIMALLERSRQFGGGTRAFDSDAEKKILQDQTATVSKTREMNLSYAAVIDGSMQRMDDYEVVRAGAFAKLGDANAAQAVADEYAASTSYYTRNEGGYIELNKNRQDPTEFVMQKFGIDKEAVSTSIETAAPIQRPEQAPAQQPGSQSATPFQPTSNSATPLSSGTEQTALQKPATKKDVAAIAQSIESGQGVNQFRSSGPLPKKLAQATPDLIARVAYHENVSQGSPTDVSSAGAKGPMQMMDATGEELAGKIGEEYDSGSIPQNIALGKDYLNQLLKNRDGNVQLALADYNWGMGNVDAALKKAKLNNANGTIAGLSKATFVPEETQKYVEAVTGPQSFQMASYNEPGANTPLYKTDALGETRKYQSSKNIDNPMIDEPGVIVPGSEQTPVPEKQPDGVRGTPPPSALIEGLQQLNPFAASVAQADTGEPTPKEKPTKPMLAKAAEWLDKNPVGQFLSEYSRLGEGMANSLVNSVMFGYYDEGMGVLATALGFDGKEATNAIKDQDRAFKKENPGLHTYADIAGFVAGWKGLKAIGEATGITGLLRSGKTIEEIKAAHEAQGAFRKGARVAGEVAAPMFLRGTGEAEGGATQRLVGGTVGAGIGVTAAGVISAASKLPIIGPALAAGSVIGSLLNPTNPLFGGAKGALTGAALGVIKSSPSFQKALGAAVYKFSTNAGLRTIGTAITKIITSKTPEEIAQRLTPGEALASKLLSYMPKNEMLKNLSSLIKARIEGVPLKLSDVSENSPMWGRLQAIREMTADETSALTAKINKAVQERNAGQEGRLGDILNAVSPEETTQRIANRIISRIEGTRTGSQKLISEKFKPQYEGIEQANPVLETPEVQTLLKNNTLQQVISEVRKEPELGLKAEKPAPKSSSDKAKDLAEQMYQRLLKGESIDDLAATEAKPGEYLFADNSYRILKRAEEKLSDQANKLFKDGLDNEGRKVAIVRDALKGELEKAPGFEEAQAGYRAAKQKIEPLSKNAMQGITDLQNGDVEKALPNLLGLPAGEFDRFQTAFLNEAQSVQLGAKAPAGAEGGLYGGEAQQANAEALKAVVRGFVEGKIQATKRDPTIDLSKKLFTNNQWKNVESILGKEEAAGLDALLQREQQIMKGSKAIGGGSPTVAKSGQKAAIEQEAGAGESPLGTAQLSFSASLKGTVARALNAVWPMFGSKANVKNLESIADTLFLDADKGIEAMVKLVKAKGLKEEGIKQLQPIFRKLAEYGITTTEGGLGTLPGDIAKGEAANITATAIRGMGNQRKPGKK